MNDWVERHRSSLVLILINLMSLAGFTFTMRRPTHQLVEILPPPTVTPAPTATPVILKVYVTGAVAHPAVYDLQEGSRIEQAIAAAGGFTADAFEPGINLAQPLFDGQQIYVPHQDEVQMAGPVSVSIQAESAFVAGQSGARVVPLINLNTASATELATLPGIGPAIADRIVAYRESNGPFQQIEDIKRVKGIGNAIFEKIKDRITVGK